MTLAGLGGPSAWAPVQPMPNPRGCQATRPSVAKKIAMADMKGLTQERKAGSQR